MKERFKQGEDEAGEYLAERIGGLLEALNYISTWEKCQQKTAVVQCEATSKPSD